MNKLKCLMLGGLIIMAGFGFIACKSTDGAKKKPKKKKGKCDTCPDFTKAEIGKTIHFFEVA